MKLFTLTIFVTTLYSYSHASNYKNEKQKLMEDLKICEIKCKAGVDNKCLPVETSRTIERVSRPILAIAESVFYSTRVLACQNYIHTKDNRVHFENNKLDCEKQSDYISHRQNSTTTRSFLPRDFNGVVEQSDESKLIYFERKESPSFIINTNYNGQESIFGGRLAIMSTQGDKVFWVSYDKKGCFRAGF